MRKLKEYLDTLTSLAVLLGLVFVIIVELQRGMIPQLIASLVGVGAALTVDMLPTGSRRRLVRTLCPLLILSLAAAAGILHGHGSFALPPAALAAWSGTWVVLSLAIPYVLGRWMMNRWRARGMAPLKALGGGLAVGLVVGWFLLPFAVGMLLAVLFGG